MAEDARMLQDLDTIAFLLGRDAQVDHEEGRRLTKTLMELRDRALSSPRACIDAEDVENWIAGLSTMDDAVARAAEANALIKRLRERSPCACEGRKPLKVLAANLWHDYKRLYHLDVDLSLEMASYTKQRIPVAVIILPADEGAKE